MTPLDLTPFGFTATESRVYQALLSLGPTTGYRVAQTARIARANAYEALSRLAARGVVSVIETRPLRVRAVRGDALVALLASEHSVQLDTLDRQLRMHEDGGEESRPIPITTARALEHLSTRLIVSEAAALHAVGPAPFFRAVLAAIRKRLADGRPMSILSIGDEDLAIQGSYLRIPRDQAERAFGSDLVLLAGTSGAIWASQIDQTVTGWRSDDKASVRVVNAAIARIQGVLG